MHSGFVGYEQQYQIKKADGTTLWAGTALLGRVFQVVNTSGAAAVSGTAMIVDLVNPVAPDTPARYTTLGRDDNLTTNDPIHVNLAAIPVVSAASLCFLGVLLEPLAATPAGTELDSTPVLTQKRGLVAGPSSICTVICTSAAIAAGARIGGSGTAAQCAAIAAANPTGITLGVCVKANAQMGASGNYAAGVLVSPL